MQSLQDCYQGLEIQLLERRYGSAARDRKNFSEFCMFFFKCCIQSCKSRDKYFKSKNSTDRGKDMFVIQH